MTPERRSEIETILDHLNYSWTQRESDAISDLFAEIDRRHEAASNTQRGADGGAGQETLFDAIYHSDDAPEWRYT